MKGRREYFKMWHSFPAEFRQLCVCYDDVCSSWQLALCSSDIDPARRAEDRHSCFLMSERISSPVTRVSFYSGAIGFESRAWSRSSYVGIFVRLPAFFHANTHIDGSSASLHKNHYIISHCEAQKETSRVWFNIWGISNSSTLHVSKTGFNYANKMVFKKFIIP